MSLFVHRESVPKTEAMTPADAERDLVRRELIERLESLDGHCLTNLVHGIEAAVAGDLTVEVLAATERIERTPDDEMTARLVNVFNSMLANAQRALVGYEELRVQLRTALGDSSSLAPLQERLNSLSDHCLAGLGDGLRAAAHGDLTIDARAVTTPLEVSSRSQLGQLGEVFNRMLSQAQGGISSYNSMRAELATMIGEIGATAGQVSSSSQSMSAASQQTSSAIEQIAQATNSVAAGAEKQTGMVGAGSPGHCRSGRAVRACAGGRG